LGFFVGVYISSFKLNPDRKIVYISPAQTRGNSGMPGPHREWNELKDFSVATNKKMSRDFESVERGKTGVCVDIELIKEQSNHRIPAKLPGRETDSMKHNDLYLGAFRSGITIR
jgi:hypothetical protein